MNRTCEIAELWLQQVKITGEWDLFGFCSVKKSLFVREVKLKYL